MSAGMLASFARENRVAIDLGLTLVENRLGPPSPRGNDTGHVLWAVPAGLLQLVHAHHDPEAGNTYWYKVVSGPFVGRRLRAYSGSRWFQPALEWAYWPALATVAP